MTVFDSYQVPYLKEIMYFDYSEVKTLEEKNTVDL